MSSPVLAARKYVELSDRVLVDWALKSGAPRGKTRTQLLRWPPARGQRPKQAQFKEVTFARAPAQGPKPLNYCSPSDAPQEFKLPMGWAQFPRRSFRRHLRASRKRPGKTRRLPLGKRESWSPYAKARARVCKHTRFLVGRRAELESPRHPATRCQDQDGRQARPLTRRVGNEHIG